uniref:ADP-ribosylation factor-like protein 13B n=1 Tax=Parastrongyloides trichosuri TaxID=131310 RepID=A0A0N4Z1U9_PARTI
MGNCGLCSGGFKERKNRIFPASDKKIITLCLLGPEGVGKTTIIKALRGESPENVTKTNGFSQESLKFLRANLKVYDLGGNEKIREIWTNYYGEVYGSVFVWDTSNHSDEDLLAAKTMMEAIVNNPDMSGKPILILLNKKDGDNNVTEFDFCDKTSLHQIAAETNSHFKVINCNALKGYGKDIDPYIIEGFEWLLDDIKQNFDAIDSRVQQAIEELKKKQQEERVKRQHRLAALQAEHAEEDAKLEQAERAANGNIYSGEPQQMESVDENVNVIPDVLPSKSLPPLRTNKVVPQNEEDKNEGEGPKLEIFEIKSEDREFSENIEMQDMNNRKEISIQTELSFPVYYENNNDEEEADIATKISMNRRASLRTTNDINKNLKSISIAPVD